MVIELKGPTAYVNYSPSKGIYQTEKYRQAYAADPQFACECSEFVDGPYLVLLDARSRSRADVMAKEEIPESAFAGWAWFGYQDVLPHDPFRHHPVAAWLLAAR